MFNVGDRVQVRWGSSVEIGIVEYVFDEQKYGVYVANCIFAECNAKDIMKVGE